MKEKMNKILKTILIIIVILSAPSYCVENNKFSGENKHQKTFNDRDEKEKNVEYPDFGNQLLVEFTNGEKSFELCPLLSVDSIGKQLEMVAEQIQIIEKEHNANDVLYRLGKAAYKAKRYREGNLYFEKLVDIGFQYSSKDILEMIRDGKISTSLEIPIFRTNQFFAIYILNGYELPANFNRKEVKFSYGKPEMNNDTTTKGDAGFCTEILNNTGFVSFPYIWVKKSLNNEGVIEASILVVGNKVITGGEPVGNGSYRFEGFPRRQVPAVD